MSYDELEKVLNKNHESDVENALCYTRWLLRFLGIWPYVITNPTKIERLISKLMLLFSTLFTMIVVTFLILHAILCDISNSELLMLIGPIIFQITCTIKHALLLFHSSSIKICVKNMKSDWKKIGNEIDREIMIKNLKIGDEITLMCGIFMYSGSTFYHIVLPLWRGNSINVFNETVKPLAYPGGDIFLDPRNGYNYEIIFFIICTCSFFLYTIVTAACNLAAIFVTHACGQICIVMSRLENLSRFNDEIIDKNVVADRIAFIVQSHVRVLKFSSQIDEILRGICLLEVVASTIMICLLEYYCMTEWNNSDSIAILTYVLLLGSFSFNVFIYCYIGELLKAQCQQVRTAAYNLEWYRFPGKTGLALVMIIIMANYPRKLTAGRMLELSIYTFGTIMKTSLAYLNMLRTVAE